MTNHNPYLLVIEDETDIAELIQYNLEQAGFQTQLAQDGKHGYELAIKTPPQLIILDLMLPVLNGIEICRLLRNRPQTCQIPILMLTAKAQESDRILGFEAGADDYLAKPFSPRELLLRVQAILKRSQAVLANQAWISFQNLQIDQERHRVWLDQQEISLTATEFKLLEFLLKSKGRILTRDLLLDQVWGYEVAITGRAVDTHVKRLREKLGAAGDLIETVRGVGYRLREGG